MSNPENQTKVRRGKATITIPLCEYSDLRAKLAALEAENTRLTSLLNDTWPEHMKKYQALEAERDALKLTIRQLHTQIDAELETGHRVLLKAQALEAEVQKLRAAALKAYETIALYRRLSTPMAKEFAEKMLAALNSNAGDKNTL